jgi:glycosyltransferase involved in cell wall biosynthesis
MYHGNLMAALAHRLARGRSDRRLLWNLRASNMDLIRYSRVIRLGSALSAWPDVVIANSRAGALFHASQGFCARRTEIIANGIDTQKFRPDVAARSALRAELGIDTGTVVVMNAARVDPMKDHATFLKAMADVPGIVGIMAGARTETLSAPPNVRAFGLRRDIERLYAMADIVISTSAFGEGFSNAIAEGMGAGLTPIATDVGDAPSLATPDILFVRAIPRPWSPRSASSGRCRTRIGLLGAFEHARE